jgi:hypothetical protein
MRGVFCLRQDEKPPIESTDLALNHQPANGRRRPSDLVKGRGGSFVD